MLACALSNFPRTHRFIHQALENQVVPGVVIGIWWQQKPEDFWAHAWGFRRLTPSSLPMQVDTLFDLASLTKIFATTMLAARLVDRGWIQWETPIQALLLDYPYPGMSLRHLLSHTAGFPAWKPFFEHLKARFKKSLPEVCIAERQRVMKQAIYHIAPEVSPGIRMTYSDISFLLLGFVLEAVTHLPLDQAVRRWVWDPLTIKNARYVRIQKARFHDERVAATEESGWRGGLLQGEVHDENAWAMGGYGGHAGAFATVSDLMQWSACLITGKALSQSVLQALWTRIQEPAECSRTLGWDTPSGPFPAVGQYFSKKTVGHSGFTGTSLWFDLSAGLAIALLTNRVHLSVNQDESKEKIRIFRSHLHDQIRLDLKDHLGIEIFYE